jgi:hypothetical protein
MNKQNMISFLETEGVSTMTTSLEAKFYAERAGQVYFVDGNKTDDSGDGSTWDNAFMYLSTALAASHANIALTAARNWAGRNTIYVKGDPITEDLVLFADKTDVIGVGAKDSYDMPCIVGNHVPTNGMSTRFFNVQFRGAVASGGIIMTLTSGNSGIKFVGCHFNGWSTTPATIGLKSTASPRLEVIGCKFFGAFSTAAIHLLTGDGNGTVIKNNLIQSAGIGIDIDSGFTCANEQAWIVDNRIISTGLVIDDDATGLAIMGNLGSSAGALGATSHDITHVGSAGNIISGATTAATVPFATIA